MRVHSVVIGDGTVSGKPRMQTVGTAHKYRWWDVGVVGGGRGRGWAERERVCVCTGTCDERETRESDHALKKKKEQQKAL